MENAILKKRLSTYKSEKGTITRVPDDLLIDILRAWESWSGTAKAFYEEIGLSKMQLGGLMKKAKKLSRDLPASEFKEIAMETLGSVASSSVPCQGIELGLHDGKVIRFPSVDPLVEFLRKTA